MFVYSKNIVRFIAEVERLVAALLRYEVRLKVNNSRFTNRTGDTSYPIKVVIFNDRKELGYFDPNFYELAFHVRSLHFSREKLLNLIRHELAHYLLFIDNDNPCDAHGEEYKKLCMSYGWGEEVYRSAMAIDEADVGGAEESAVLRRVKKLMALASSSNENEAEQAMIKSQQLLLQHNLESCYLEDEGESRYYKKRILPYKRRSEKIVSIGRILETFFVHVVYTSGKEMSYLQILGSEENVEIAEYVADFLDEELERVWERIKKERGLKGITSRNSFFRGVARGYLEKMGALKRSYSAEVQQGVLVIENQLEEASSLAYKKLGKFRSKAMECGFSSQLGHAMGRDLNIRRGIYRDEDSTKALTYGDR